MPAPHPGCAPYKVFDSIVSLCFGATPNPRLASCTLFGSIMSLCFGPAPHPGRATCTLSGSIMSLCFPLQKGGSALRTTRSVVAFVNITKRPLQDASETENVAAGELDGSFGAVALEGGFLTDAAGVVVEGVDGGEGAGCGQSVGDVGVFLVRGRHGLCWYAVE